MSDQTWLTDDNGNRCSVEYFGSRDAAQTALDSLHRPLAAVPRLEATADQIDAINTAVALAVTAAEENAAQSLRRVRSYTQDLERANTEANKSALSISLREAIYHLDRDRLALKKSRAAWDFMHIVTIEVMS